MKCKLTKIDCDKNNYGFCMKYRKQLNKVTQEEWNDCFDGEIIESRLVALSKKEHNKLHRPLQDYSTYELLHEVLLRESDKS